MKQIQQKTFTITADSPENLQAKIKVIQNLLNKVDDAMFLCICNKIEQDADFMANVLNKPMVKLFLN